MTAGKYERTAVPYPTYGPSDGRSWHEYFVDLKALQRGDVIETVDEDGIRYVTAAEPKGDDDSEAGVPQVTVPLHEITLSTEWVAPSAMRTICKLLEANGWKWKLYHAQSFTEGKVYGQGAQKAGQKRDDRCTDVFLVRASRNLHTTVVSYHSVNGKATSNVRMVNNLLGLVSDRELKDWIKSDSTDSS